MLSCRPLPASLAANNRPVTTWAIAVPFFNRFYARKSMTKNNSFVSGGCCAGGGQLSQLSHGAAQSRVWCMLLSCKAVVVQLACLCAPSSTQSTVRSLRPPCLGGPYHRAGGRAGASWPLRCCEHQEQRFVAAHMPTLVWPAAQHQVILPMAYLLSSVLLPQSQLRRWPCTAAPRLACAAILAVI